MPDEPLSNAPVPSPEAKMPVAWQPFTPRGVAAFAGAGTARVMLVELLVALLSTAVVVWFLSTVWFPAVREAIQQLPAAGTIENGEMKWPGAPLQVLQERRPFLALLVDLNHETKGHSGIDLSLRFHRRALEVFGPLGSLTFPYPKDYLIEFNRPELEPRWGAWQPILLGWTAVLAPLWLFLVWAALATLYFAPAWLLAFYANRQLSWGGSWRLCSAALMPGALLYSLCIVLYGLAVLDIFHLALASILHIVIGWIYVIGSVAQLPRVPDVLPSSVNPFGAKAAETGDSENPFAGKNPDTDAAAKANNQPPVDDKENGAGI